MNIDHKSKTCYNNTVQEEDLNDTYSRCNLFIADLDEF